MDIKPIETVYNGYRFRSRLEARWAVFFDKIGIKYQYEPEGYEVDLGDKVIRYLPDFYLPDQNIHAEVKPSFEKLMEDSEKLAWMIDYDGPMSNGLLVLGQIPKFDYELLADYIPGFIFLKWDCGIMHQWATFTITPNLVIDDLFNEGCATAPNLIDTPDRRYLAEIGDLYMKFRNMDKCVSGEWYELSPVRIPSEAYFAARQARFEHGETPTV